MANNYFAGIDIGSSTSKVVIIDSYGNIRNSLVKKTGIDMVAIASEIFSQIKNESNIIDISYTISTGYGRKIIDFSDGNVTEITCTARGAYQLYNSIAPFSVVDIGGQDNKIILVRQDGTIETFKMNRKCSAGTGAFLEEIAWKLDLQVDKMNELAQKEITGIVDKQNLEKPLNSFCSVFASTEILEKIRQGEPLEKMLISSYHSIVRRLFDMAIINKSIPIVMSGGVIQYHPIIQKILEIGYKFTVHIPSKPQIIPAYGAALIAKEKFENSKVIITT